MLDRLDALETKLRDILSLEPITKAIAEKKKTDAEMVAKVEAENRKINRETKDKQLEAEGKSVETRAKAVEETDPTKAETMRAEFKAKHDAWERQKDDEDRRDAESKKVADEKEAPAPVVAEPFVPPQPASHWPEQEMTSSA
jgi:hypothetical protein